MIRRADSGRDAAACAAIYAPYVSETAISFEEVAPDAAQMRARIERATAAHAWLVAEAGGAVVGFAYATPHRERAAYRWACEVSVYVDGEQRRRGVGRALYEVLLPLLCAQRLHVACAGITLPNEASVQLHESLGFEPVGVYREIGFKLDRWHDVGWWQLQLLPAGDAPVD